MAAIKLFISILLLTYAWSSRMYSGHLLSTERARVLQIAEGEVGVKELTGKNDGARVEQYLKLVNHRKGAPWCAAFLSWVFSEAGFVEPRTAWTPAMFPGKRIVSTPRQADIIGIYFPDLKRIGHVGLVNNIRGDWVYTIEGNTSLAGGRDGDGVYRKVRHILTVHRISDWITGGRYEQ